MKKEPQIKFEKWESPYGDDAEARDLPDIDYEDEDGEEQSVNLRHIMDEDKKTQIIATPLGIIPLNEFSDPSKVFNFWCGHTNFVINKDVENILYRAEGVEAYLTFSPYRFRIAIGKLFEEQEVMEEIKRTVLAFLG